MTINPGGETSEQNWQQTESGEVPFIQSKSAVFQKFGKCDAYFQVKFIYNFIRISTLFPKLFFISNAFHIPNAFISLF